RCLLPDRDVDADDALPLLVDDRVDGDRRLAGAAVADDQLPLPAADWDESIDRLDAGLHRLLHRLPQHNAWCDNVDLPAVGGADGALAVDGLPQRIDDAAQVLRPHRDVEYPTGATH